jgi:hypothetical protein
MDSWFIDAFADTRLGELVRDLTALIGPILPFVAGGVVLLIGVAAGFVYIAKGAGQYGIIEGYVGMIGAGKTTLAVQHALELARTRKAVLLANIPVRCGPHCAGRESRRFVVDRRCPRKCLEDHVHERRFCELEHGTLPMGDDGLDVGTLMDRAFALRDEQRGLVLLMDEVGVVMPSRLWKDFPVTLMWTLQQSRKLACEWVWTAQDASFVDNQLRSLTSVVHYVRSFPPSSIWRRHRGKRPWFLMTQTFTPTAAPRANGEGMRADRLIARKLKRYRRAWEGAFDTDGIVLPSRHVKGAQLLHDAVGSDAHAIRATMGVGMGGDPEPAVTPP